jgi:hypothetical protein
MNNSIRICDAGGTLLSPAWRAAGLQLIDALCYE